LISSEIEPINLDDAENYFNEGNWAHPLLDAIKLLKVDETNKKANETLSQALKMKKEAIEKAEINEEKYHDKMRKLLEYNKLLEKAKKIGRENKDFDGALKSMEDAIELMPDEGEARWGYATALHHAERFDESIKEYKELIETFPDNNTFRFEYGQVLLRNNQLQKGLQEIGKVMETTDEFDSFLARLGDIYSEGNMYKEAIIAYKSYLKKFPYDYKIWIAKGNCFSKWRLSSLAKVAYKKAREIKPDCDIPEPY